MTATLKVSLCSPQQNADQIKSGSGWAYISFYVFQKNGGQPQLSGLITFIGKTPASASGASFKVGTDIREIPLRLNSASPIANVWNEMYAFDVDESDLEYLATIVQAGERFQVRISGQVTYDWEATPLELNELKLCLQTIRLLRNS